MRWTVKQSTGIQLTIFGGTVQDGSHSKIGLHPTPQKTAWSGPGDRTGAEVNCLIRSWKVDSDDYKLNLCDNFQLTSFQGFVSIIPVFTLNYSATIWPIWVIFLEKAFAHNFQLLGQVSCFYCSSSQLTTI